MKYGKFLAVDRASFAMPPGACGLLGKNGAGKSSILKAVLGLIRPSGGHASVLGLDTQHDAITIRDRIGYMPEKEAFFPGLTGLESVMLAGQLSGLPRGEAKRRAHEVLYLVGLDEPRYRQVASYSLGMKQKIKLAGALVHDPELLFLDEPTNGLDPKARREILALMRELVVSKGKSLILSSHILSDVESLCEHVVLIDDGRIVRTGPLEEMTRASERGYSVRLAEPSEDFVGALRVAGLRVEVDEESARLYRVWLDVGKPTTVIFDAIAHSGAQLRSFEQIRRGLSEVFRDAVGADAARGVGS